MVEEKQNLKISIITATWRSEESVGETASSLAAQDYPRELIEWIVVDGASPDRTIEVIKQSAFAPDKLLSEPDDGIYDALNKGVRLATGDVVAFLHADDFLAAPDALSRVADAFVSSGATAVYGDLEYVRPRVDGGYSVVRHWKSGVYSRGKLGWGWMPPHPALFVKKEIYDRAERAPGEYFDTSLSCAADYDFMVRILSRLNVEPAYLKMVLVKMRVGGVSNRSLKHIIQKSREDWRVIRSNRIGHVHTLIWKNLSKVGQFFAKE